MYSQSTPRTSEELDADTAHYRPIECIHIYTHATFIHTSTQLPKSTCPYIRTRLRSRTHNWRRRHLAHPFTTATANTIANATTTHMPVANAAPTLAPRDGYSDTKTQLP